MAYQARQRERLLDEVTQAAIERRGRELLGVVLTVMGVALALILASYVPDDPSWLSATDTPAENLLGRFGASIASPLYVIVGWGAWGIVAVFLAWGVRFLTHRGSERAIQRLIFAPLGVALAAVYASTHLPFNDWTHSFGLGGLFGDTVLGAVLNVVPVQAGLGLKLMSLLMGAAMVTFGFYVLGFDKEEMRGLGRLLFVGTVVLYIGAVKLLRGGVRGGVTGAVHAGRGWSQRRSERQDLRAQERAARAETLPEFDPAPDERVRAPRAGLGLKMPSLVKRQAPVAEPEDFVVEAEDDTEDARIREKITGVIKARMRGQEPLRVSRAETRTEAAIRGARRPEPLVVAPRGARAVAEPPVTAAAAAAAATGAEAPMPALETAAPAPTSPYAAVASRPAKRLDIEDAEVDMEAEAPMEISPEINRVAAHQQRRIATPEPESRVVMKPRKPVAPSSKAMAEAQPALRFDADVPEYETPPLSLLANPDNVERLQLSDEALEENARMLENVLDDYGVKGEIVSVRPGPVVTMYELEPAPGLKASRVIGLADDIARSMSALSARVSTVPGRSVIGIELPNAKREMVVLREILAARDFGDSNMRLPLALGKDIGGDPIVANLAKMPHLLIAGTTGSGKSVAINTMILSLLYKLTPEECRLIMIDPKMLELSVYDGIPHLLSPVVTDPKKAVVALKWVVGEMEDRYRKMSKMGVRNIEGYNSRVRDALSKGEMFSRTVQTGFDDDTGEPVFETEEFAPEILPFIVVIVDEMADLMMVAGKEIEACIQRLAQMARASGIHLIMATQRPSVDVITGTIKANFPTRISFQVTSKIDSRTILGEQGAEQLLGMGDMLYMAGGSKITRIHGPFCSDEEVEEIVNHLKAYGPPDYKSGVVDGPDEDKESDIDAVLGLGGNTDGEDALYDQAVAIVIKDRKCSTSYIQRKLAIGYNKAARLVEQMEDQGVVSASNHVGKREVLVPEQH